VSRNDRAQVERVEEVLRERAAARSRPDAALLARAERASARSRRETKEAVAAFLGRERCGLCAAPLIWAADELVCARPACREAER
jgi:hypothetical protein